MEDEDRSLVGVESFEGVGQHFRVADALRDRRAGGPVVVRRVEADLADALPLSELCAAGIDEDPAQPRVEAVGIAQPCELPPRRDEGVLGGVARIGVVAEDGARDPECASEWAVTSCSNASASPRAARRTSAPWLEMGIAAAVAAIGSI